MKVFQFIWITLLFMPTFGLFAQNENSIRSEVDYNYAIFRQTFDEELKGLQTSGEDKNSSSVFMYSDVPGWLTGLTGGSSSALLVIGISDPLEDTAFAMKQALSRAYYMASLMTSATVNNLVEYYLEDFKTRSSEVTGQYVDYFEMISSFPAENSDAKIVHKDFTDFGECILQVEINAFGHLPSSTPAKTVGMIQEFEKDGLYEGNSRIELNWKISSESYKYLSRSVNNLIETESWIQQEQLPLNPSKLKYKTIKPKVENQHLDGARTDRGLWNAYLNAVLKEITVRLRSLPSELKSSSDNYSGKTETLNRETLSGNITFRINQVTLEDNRFWTRLDQFNFTQP